MVERKLVVGKLMDRFVWGSGNVCLGSQNQWSQVLTRVSQGHLRELPGMGVESCQGRVEPEQLGLKI